MVSGRGSRGSIPLPSDTGWRPPVPPASTVSLVRPPPGGDLVRIKVKGRSHWNECGCTDKTREWKDPGMEGRPRGGLLPGVTRRDHIYSAPTSDQGWAGAGLPTAAPPPARPVGDWGYVMPSFTSLDMSAEVSCAQTATYHICPSQLKAGESKALPARPAVSLNHIETCHQGALAAGGVF